MRTKALLCAATLLAAGVATSMAQSNVYSLNVVGYVNTTLPHGLTMIANPLDAGNNTITNLFLTLDSTAAQYTVISWNGGGFDVNDLDQFGGGWNNPNLVLGPGRGFFFKNQGTAVTNTWVGTVLQGQLVVALSPDPGLSLVASKVPQTGFAGDLGLIPTAGTSHLILWNGGGFETSDFDQFDSTWTPVGSHTVDSAKGPQLGIGEAVFFKGDTGDMATWSRNFTVQ